MATPLSGDGYVGFGSFMTPPVQHMIEQEYWTGPRLPDPICLVRQQQMAQTPLAFGQPMRPNFSIDFAAFVFLNHGAFGACLRLCYAEVRAWQEHCEAQPLRFIDSNPPLVVPHHEGTACRELFPQMVALLRDMATFVGCKPTELAFLPNATTGLNTIMESVPLSTHDEVLMLDIGYGSLKTIAESRCRKAGASLVQAHVALPLRLAADLEAALLSKLSVRTRLVILDSVTSNTGIVLPLKELISACRSRFPDVLVLVDAAHSLGQLEVSVPDLGADFWVANCHKWLCAPRGTAVMWVREDRQHLVQPLIISHGHGHGFTSDFIWDGCRDYAPYLAVGGALAWWRAAGGDKARGYMRTLLSEAVAMLTQRWESGTVAPLSMCASMACVQLPATLQVVSGEATSAHAKTLQDALYNGGIEVPIKCLHGQLYCRISAHVYNVMGDFEALAVAVLSHTPPWRVACRA